MPRRVSGTVFIDAIDHETFGANETGQSTQTFSLVIDENMPANRINIAPLRVGGEVRVELEIAVQAQSDGIVQVSGTARLFEGASEDTDDLEDQQDVTFSVPRGGVPARFNIELRNRGFDGGDSARISTVVTNSVFEE
jgi:hypothetical protein